MSEVACNSKWNEIFANDKCCIKFVWIPSHVGVGGLAACSLQGAVTALALSQLLADVWCEQVAVVGVWCAG